MPELTVEQRVANGVEWLDERWPEWVRAINLDDLDLADSCNCVLGQRRGDFDEALDSEDMSLDDAVRNGFYAGHPSQNRDAYVALNAMWRRVIEARREAATHG